MINQVDFMLGLAAGMCLMVFLIGVFLSAQNYYESKRQLAQAFEEVKTVPEVEILTPTPIINDVEARQDRNRRSYRRDI